MTTPLAKDVGAFLTHTKSIDIQNVDASAGVDGASVSRHPDKTNDQGTPALSAVIIAVLGSATGTPTAQTHRFKVQESATGSGSWSDVADATLDLTSDGEVATLDLNLTEREPYLRVVYDETNSSFTGGSTPTNDIFACIELGGYAETAQ